MATATSNLTALPQAAPADPTPFAVNRTQPASAPGEFQAALNAAGQPTRAAPTRDVPPADDADDEQAVPDATVTGLVGLVNQFQFLNPAVNAAVAQANGTEAATAVEDATNDATRARADELLLNSTGGPTQLATTAQQTNVANLPATENVPAQRPANAVPPAAQAQVPVPAVHTQSQPQVPDAAEIANAIAVRGGLPNIPPPAPIVVNPAAMPPTPVDLSKAAPVVNATGAAVAASALPAAELGNRPAMEGEKFAALASAGAQVAAMAPQPPRSGVFENILDEVATRIGSNRPPTAEAAIPNQLPNLAAPMAPASTGSLTSAPTPVSHQVADAVVSQARVLERPGSVEFQMRLDPPELGQLQIRLIARGDEVHGQVLVADQAVRQMLESQLPELRQRLEAAGVNVQSFNVAADTNGGNRNPYRDTPEFAPLRTSAETSIAPPRVRIGRAEVTSTLDVTV